MFKGLSYIYVSEWKRPDKREEETSSLPMKKLQYFSNFRLPKFKTNKQTNLESFSLPNYTQGATFVKAYAEVAHRALKSTVKTLPNNSEKKANKQCCKHSNECAEHIGN